MKGKTKTLKKSQTSYKVLVYNAKRLEKDKRGISASVRIRIKTKLESLAFPFPVNLDIKHLKDIFYRLRVGNYRVLLGVDSSQKTIWILSIRKRDKMTYKFLDNLMVL